MLEKSINTIYLANFHLTDFVKRDKVFDVDFELHYQSLPSTYKNKKIFKYLFSSSK